SSSASCSLSLHDALPIYHSVTVTEWADGMPLVVPAWPAPGIPTVSSRHECALRLLVATSGPLVGSPPRQARPLVATSVRNALERSEEHTSELQSRVDLVC